MYQPTSRNHYNPCFWVALWNSEYFREWQSASSPLKRHAREQSVWVLNLRSDRIYESKVEGVHFHKGFGVAEISPESMLDWCKRWHPSRVEALAEHVRQDPHPLYLDFEPTLHGLEQLQGYEAIMNAARNERILSATHKGFLACALIDHAMRSYELSTSMIQRQGQPGQPSKWEYLWLLKTAWANELVGARATLPLAMGQWTLWRTGDFTFPLCDSPVVVHRDGLVAVLSPRLLLEIDLTVSQPEDQWILREEVPPQELDVFRGALLANTFKELVAWDRATLERWKSDARCQTRVRALSSQEGRHTTIEDAAERVVWGLMGFGRVPDDFEKWGPAVRDKVLQSDQGRALLSELRSQSAVRHDHRQD